MGPGRIIPWSNFEGVVKQARRIGNTSPSIAKCKWRGNVQNSETPAYVEADPSTEFEDEHRGTVGEKKEDDMLFPCPEEGCMKSYSRFANLQTHLDTGKHKMKLVS